MIPGFTQTGIPRKRIAFFDFDGTITTHDTLLEIIKYNRGVFSFYLGFLLCSPFLVLYKLKVISNQAAKEITLRWFYGKMPLEKFQQGCNAFEAEKIPSFIRPKAFEEIKRLKAAQAEVVIVSASAENWLGAWCERHDLRLLATKLEIKNNRITGKIEGYNCHGKEKVRRIQEAYDLSQYDEVYCYGDTKGDKPMLGLATFPFYRPFR
ncbi:MAG: HAD-IB family hydrolase [Bacteroidetes bacterium]|nr:HAD-IB family hydrolase [Bacteroidota bacterium]